MSRYDSINSTDSGDNANEDNLNTEEPRSMDDVFKLVPARLGDHWPESLEYG